MPRKYKYFSNSDAALASRLSFTARKAVEGALTGIHKSPHRGFSVEFSEHREYAPGDELRRLDWKVYARADRYYVKLYEQETNLRATLVLDSSSSMQFGHKDDYARLLCASLAYLLNRQQDQAGLVVVDETIRAHIPPACSPSHLDRLFKTLESTQHAQTRSSHLAENLHALAEQLPRRSLLILISDLWIEPSDLTKALNHLSSKRHQTLILHLLDRKEITLDYDKPLTFQDLETEEKIQVNPADLKKEYKKQVEAFLQQIRRCCADSDVEYHPIYTDTPHDKALVQLINRRG